MTELETLLKDIENLRNILTDLITEKGSLQNQEVIKASQELNEAIVKYSKMIIGKIK